MSGLMQMRRGIVLGLVMLGLGAIVAGCGGEDEGGSGSTPAATPTVDNAEALRDLENAPPLPDRTGAAPPELQTRDVVEGEGPGAKSGDRLTMQYSGWLYDTGDPFDSSWTRDEPFEFELGARGPRGVIRGWNEGIVGMRAGGRRVLTVPAADAYGAQGRQPTIPPDAPLIFVVDLQAIG